MHYIIIGNFGNHSLAAMQALIERRLAGVHFIYVETGWAASTWPARVALCADYARCQNVTVHHLKSQASFTEMVMDRRQFPSGKFQWCASFLKGLPIIDCLDDIDPGCDALIVSGKRRLDSRRYANLQEFDYHDDLYQGRTLWHPLWQTNHDEFTQLILRAGFAPLLHQSLECSPCIHMRAEALGSLDQESVKRTAKLEQCLKQSMFHKPIAEFLIGSAKSTQTHPLSLEQFDQGCGASWGCGE